MAAVGHGRFILAHCPLRAPYPACFPFAVFSFVRMLRLFALSILTLGRLGDGCTNIAVGRHATTDGSTMVAHTDDSGPQAMDLRLVRVPDMDHHHGARRHVYLNNGGYPRLVTHERGPGYQPVHGQHESPALGSIPQVAHTYGYWDQDYGLLNSVGLGIAETTCGAKTAGWPSTVPGGHNMWSIRELSKVALERCETARCAIKLMGALAEEHGFYGDDVGPPGAPVYIGSSEALSLSDRKVHCLAPMLSSNGLRGVMPRWGGGRRLATVGGYQGVGGENVH